MTTAHCSSSTYMLIFVASENEAFMSVCLARYGCMGDLELV